MGNSLPLPGPISPLICLLNLADLDRCSAVTLVTVAWTESLTRAFVHSFIHSFKSNHLISTLSLPHSAFTFESPSTTTVLLRLHFFHSLAPSVFIAYSRPSSAPATITQPPIYTYARISFCPPLPRHNEKKKNSRQDRTLH